MNRIIKSIVFAAAGVALSVIGDKITAPIAERERQREFEERLEKAQNKDVEEAEIEIEE